MILVFPASQQSSAGQPTLASAQQSSSSSYVPLEELDWLSTISHSHDTGCLFSKRWDNVHPNAEKPPGSRDSSPNPSTIGRAGGKQDNWLHKLSNSSPTRNANQDPTARQLCTQPIRRKYACEIERAAVTFSNSATDQRREP